MTADQIIEKRDNLTADSIEELNTVLPDIQKEIWKKFLKFLKELDTDNEGRIKTTTKNLKAVTGFIYKDIANAIRNDEYKDAIMAFIKTFDESAKLTDKYFDTISKDA